MKKLILPIALLSAVGFSSCKKDRTCTCTITSNTTTYTSTIVLTKSKKANAKDFCSKSSYINTSGSQTSSYIQDCKLN